MATGDDAAARGMDLVSGTAPANTIDTLINKALDYIAFFTRWANIEGKPSSFPNSDVTNATPTSDPGKLVRWAASGSISVPSPTADTHPAHKAYADALGTTSDTPNTIMRRNANGQTAVATPTTSGMAVNKGYCDGNVAPPTTNASALTSGTLSRPVSTDGGGRFGAAYNNDITSTRRAAWLQADGTLGHASSSRYKKQDMRPAELTLEQLRGIPVILYRYRKAVAAERAGTIDHAPTEIGTIAEDLHALGLWQFVMYEGHGDEAKPVGVHYEILSLAALSLGQQLADELDTIKERLDRLEARSEAP